MEYKDYYKILGVSRDADQKEIRRAFRKLARECHPDLNPGDTSCEERFKELNEANEVLSDPDKRAKYDQLGAEWQRYQQSGAQPGDFNWGRWTTGAPGADQGVHVQYGTPEDLEDIFGGNSAFSDFFTSIFSGMGGRSTADARQRYQYQVQPRRGRDYEQELEITLREAYQGTKRLLQKEDGRRLEVIVPPGVKAGTRVRMSGEGGPGAAGGESGDLYLRVQIQPDPIFEREGDDLRVTVPVDLYTAVLGGEVHVPTLGGPVLLTIPETTQNNRVFRLRGKGMPRLKEAQQHGDLYARVEVRLPTDLSPRQREMFEELKRSQEVTQQ